MTYYLCDGLEYAPSFGFHIIVLAFLTGLYVARLIDYVMRIDEIKLIYFMGFITTILWIIAASNNYGEAKTEL
jgi:uncharacterized membrane protein